ncbi:MAG: GGDEF domain-containing protein [Eubacterium sp.]|nr:GGDEF domain-containing protein [Eubacterium sp.]
MDNSFQIVACLGTNILGFMLMITLLLSRGWRIQTKNSESKILLVMIFAIIVGCIVDPIAFLWDGKPGTFNRFIVYITNTILFTLNVVVGPGYIFLIGNHINEKFSNIKKSVIFTLCATELLLLVINFFIPLVFTVDETNTYHRSSLYFIYMVIEIGLLLYGLVIYLIARFKGRLLPFFPAWQFFIPIAVGMIMQGFFYGVSLIWPSVGIAICGMAISLQNESIFLDKLTGVYNRFYLDEVRKMLTNRKGGVIAALMMDMNGFKEINDLYSHSEGDLALIDMARILTKVVQNKGVVVRFAGDEFILLLDTSRKEAIEDYRKKIHATIDEYNNSSGKPYKLAVAVGGDIFDLQKESLSDIMNSIDQLMYEDKKVYYKTHPKKR